MKHFLDLGEISPKNPQPNNLMVLGNKKSVSAVSPVPTVSFHCADNGSLDSFAFMAAGAGGRGEGRAFSTAGMVRARTGGPAVGHFSPGGWATAKCVSPVDGDSVGAALGRVGTNPECAVKSTDKFLMVPSRIEIKDRRKVPVLKIGVRETPVRPLRQWTGSAFGRLAEAWLAAVTKRVQRRKGPATWALDLNAAAGGEGGGTNPECAPQSIDSTLTPLSKDSERGTIWL